MTFPPHLLIPLACAFVYVLGALALKRAGALGAGVWRTSFVSNWVMFLIFAPWWFWRHGPVHPLADYWQPAVTGVCFMAGHVLLLLALSKGDVSVTTPVMGTKVVAVALLSSLLRVGEVPLRWWIGAGLSAAAVALLHIGEGRGPHRRVGPTVALTGLSAASFGLGDVLLQKWVPSWGPGGYLPAMFLFVAVLSFGLVPFFREPLRTLSRETWRWVGTGSLLMSVNNAGIVLTLGIWGGATAVNIVYSARGLVSVVLVWAIGHWFSSEERHLEAGVLKARFAGAGLMVGAIALVLL